MFKLSCVHEMICFISNCVKTNWIKEKQGEEKWKRGRRKTEILKGKKKPFPRNALRLEQMMKSLDEKEKNAGSSIGLSQHISPFSLFNALKESMNFIF